MHKLIADLKELIIHAGSIALQIKDSGIITNYKDDKSPVTNADIAISELIYRGLQAINSEIVVICEERPKHKIGDTFWLVDPIDGTKSYIKGADTYTVNIALVKHAKPVIGLIYQPATSKLYYTDAEHNLCLMHNDSDKIVEITQDCNHRICVVGSQCLSNAAKNFIENHNIKTVASVPSSVKLCLIAAGNADVYPKFEPSMEWDIAAGHALVLAGGGKIVDLKGDELTYGKTNFENPYFIAHNQYWK